MFTDRQALDTAVLDPIKRKSLHGIIAAGGDGTLLDLVNRHPDCTLGILPLGNENLVAKHLMIPRNDGAQVAKIIARGQSRRFDIGQIGNRRFTVMASVGLDADVIHRVHHKRTGHINRLTYVKHILAALWQQKYPELRVYVDDAQEPVVGRFVIVANLPVYALGLVITPHVREDDGLLHVKVLQKGSTWEMLRYFHSAQQGQLNACEHVVERTGKRIRIESDSPVPIQTDGDPAGSTPCEITILPAFCRLFVNDQTVENK